MYLRQLADRLRQSLWFIPGLGLVLAGIGAGLMLLLSQWLASTNGHLPLIFGGSAEGARGILQAIAGSVVTVAGVVFSITVVALQLTSTQFSPRVLRNFMRDRPTQVTLAVFMATISYSLLVLRTVRGSGNDGEESFVPGLAVTGAMALAHVSLLMLVYFIHHIGTRIQVSSIIESVAEESLETIDDVHRTMDPMLDRGSVSDVALANPRAVRANRSGYLQYLEADGLVRIAREHDLRIRVLVPPGGWVQEGAPLFDADAPAGVSDEQLAGWLVGRAAVGAQRSMQQDVGFGVQQLVDIAVKALSPGVNDPTTATQCLDRLTQILVAVGRAADLPTALADEDGTPRLRLQYPDFAALLHQAVEQVRHYGAKNPVVARRVALSLRTLKEATPPSRHAAIVHEAQILADDVRALPAHDRGDIESVLAAIGS